MKPERGGLSVSRARTVEVYANGGRWLGSAKLGPDGTGMDNRFPPAVEELEEQSKAE